MLSWNMETLSETSVQAVASSKRSSVHTSHRLFLQGKEIVQIKGCRESIHRARILQPYAWRGERSGRLASYRMVLLAHNLSKQGKSTSGKLGLEHCVRNRLIPITRDISCITLKSDRGPEDSSLRQTVSEMRTQHIPRGYLLDKVKDSGAKSPNMTCI